MAISRLSDIPRKSNLEPIMQSILGVGKMRLLTVRHITVYRYKQPVAFGEHRMMLRPATTMTKADRARLESRLSRRRCAGCAAYSAIASPSRGSRAGPPSCLSTAPFASIIRRATPSNSRSRITPAPILSPGSEESPGPVALDRTPISRPRPRNRPLGAPVPAPAGADRHARVAGGDDYAIKERFTYVSR